ncbi:ammonia-dependent NAD(+) synthetase [Schauerella aestuarii]|uniref:ammonia-dependent NAD(+) synthetase n=1 Tax=Schauerella aestuarii TaxID=2511204 RepID=UPI00136E4B0B|nr:ammonia-dependent NAD(+) synthetase [Achromobacter aestuarii]MYZ41569.1 ammonia-dependent NAD(+) synthetase [Achromobacter aestuarii]
MTSPKLPSTSSQADIIAALDVQPTFNAADEAERRVAFLASYLERTGLRGYVLGISGGVDSSTAGRLAQLSVERLRGKGHDATFYAMRLPYGSQHDEEDAQLAMRFVAPDRALTVDIKPATDALRHALSTDAVYRDEAHQDFVIGNVKARQRMIAQYAIAGAHGALVIGTDHAAEALMGFFTKHGDGAADVTPLAGLTERRVRALARHLGAPAALIDKVRTADLESLSPQRADEDAFGLPYDTLDDFLEGREVSPTAAETIVRAYRATAHKRALPVSPGENPAI